MSIPHSSFNLCLSCHGKHEQWCFCIGNLSNCCPRWVVASRVRRIAFLGFQANLDCNTSKFWNFSTVDMPWCQRCWIFPPIGGEPCHSTSHSLWTQNWLLWVFFPRDMACYLFLPLLVLLQCHGRHHNLLPMCVHHEIHLSSPLSLLPPLCPGQIHAPMAILILLLRTPHC